MSDPRLTRSESRPRASEWSTLRTVTVALVISVGYYVGSLLGFELKFPGSTPSMLWPPNAILTAALLLTAPGRWWMYLLAALPAHLVVELGGAALPLVAGALRHQLQRGGHRRGGRALVQRGARSIRHAAPWPSSSAGRRRALRVLVSRRGGGHDVLGSRTRMSGGRDSSPTSSPSYDGARDRDPDHGAASLSAAPSSVAVSRPRSWRSCRWSSAPWSSGPFEGSGAWSRGPGTPLALLLPSILWAAVRFGPGGASLSLLTTAGFSPSGPPRTGAGPSCVWASRRVLSPSRCSYRRRDPAHVPGRAPRGAPPGPAGARGATALRGVAGAPLRRLRPPSEPPQMAAAFETWLRELGELLCLDRLPLFQVLPRRSVLGARLAWSGPGADAAPPVARLRFPLDSSGSDEGRLASAAAGRPGCRSLVAGVRSKVAIPWRRWGGLRRATVSAERDWPEPLVRRLRLVGEVFASALARKEVEEALRASERMKSAILASLPSGVAVLDRRGVSWP